MFEGKTFLYWYVLIVYITLEMNVIIPINENYCQNKEKLWWLNKNNIFIP